MCRLIGMIFWMIIGLFFAIVQGLVFLHDYVKITLEVKFSETIVANLLEFNVIIGQSDFHASVTAFVFYVTPGLICVFCIDRIELDH